MKYLNKTHWYADDLRQIAQTVVDSEVPVGGRRHLALVFTHRGQEWSTVKDHITVRVVVPKTLDDAAKIKLARDISLALLRRHQSIHMEKWHTCPIRMAAKYAWAADMQVRRKAGSIKPKGIERAKQKLENARQKLVEWESRQKRAGSRVRKWQRELARYQRMIEKEDSSPLQKSV